MREQERGQSGLREDVHRGRDSKMGKKRDVERGMGRSRLMEGELTLTY